MMMPSDVRLLCTSGRGEPFPVLDVNMPVGQAVARFAARDVRVDCRKR